MIDRVFDNYPEKEDIVQYQFSQENEKEYKLKLQVFKKSANTDYILMSMKKILGDKAVIKIEFVEYIQSLKSGKRPYIINNYRKII